MDQTSSEYYKRTISEIIRTKKNLDQLRQSEKISPEQFNNAVAKLKSAIVKAKNGDCNSACLIVSNVHKTIKNKQASARAQLNSRTSTSTSRQRSTSARKSKSTPNILALSAFMFLLPPFAIIYLATKKPNIWAINWIKAASISWCAFFILAALAGTIKQPEKVTTETSAPVTAQSMEVSTVEEVPTSTAEEPNPQTESPEPISEPESEPEPESAQAPQPEPDPVEAYAQLKSASTSTTQENPNLPLKAICEDGTIQYQDTPSLANYRGMCSHHGGIAQKLGRVP